MFDSDTTTPNHGRAGSSATERTLDKREVGWFKSSTAHHCHRRPLCEDHPGSAARALHSALTKHAVKQVDRLLSNDGIDVWCQLAHWVPLPGRRRARTSWWRWTGPRSMPMTRRRSAVPDHRPWPSGAAALADRLDRTTLKNQRNAYEDTCPACAWPNCCPPAVRVTILADRGFGDQKLFRLSRPRTWLRLRHPLSWQHPCHRRRWRRREPAADWVGKGGRARKLPDAR